MRRVLVLLTLLSACSPVGEDEPLSPDMPGSEPATAPDLRPTPPDEPAPTDTAPAANPAQDRRQAGVTVAADPPPPFTYWAPAGSVIRNHGNPGLWVAEVNGRHVKIYFGDDCGASRLQGWIGRPVDDLPAPAPPVELRVIAEGDAVIQDLRRTRLNVTHDREARRITEIACY